jgi:hypothetical protein
MQDSIMMIQDSMGQYETVHKTVMRQYSRQYETVFKTGWENASTWTLEQDLMSEIKSRMKFTAKNNL